uniref:Putative membrane protein n=1 Tax=Lutzomyia longipalpis TaxID=7200 RepID=A0A1B0GI25_LUTLO
MHFRDLKMLQPKFPKKLLCFEMKIGAIVTGWFHLLLSILGIIFTLIILFNHELYLKTLKSFAEAYNETSFVMMEDQEGDKDVMELALKLTLGFYLFISIVNFVAATLLIHGTMKENHLFLLPWLTSEVLGMFIMLCAMFVSCPYLIVVIIARVYIWYCIWAFYRDLKRNKNTSGYPIEAPSAAYGSDGLHTTKPPSYGDVVTFK